MAVKNTAKLESKGAEKAPLSLDEMANIVEQYLGVHPKYFVYEGLKLKVDIYRMNIDGKAFNGFLPHLKELGF